MSPITFVVMVFVLVGAMAYAVYSVGRWAVGPNRRRILKPGLRALGIAAVVWGVAFLTIFGTSALGSGGAITFAILICLIVFGGAALAARTMPSGGAIVCGLILMVAVWALLVGDYTAHAVGWQGLTLDDLDSGERGRGWLLVGAIFFTPQAFGVGFLVGLLAPRVILRRPAAAGG